MKNILQMNDVGLHRAPNAAHNERFPHSPLLMERLRLNLPPFLRKTSCRQNFSTYFCPKWSLGMKCKPCRWELKFRIRIVMKLLSVPLNIQ